jgi:hypothetical protein
MADTLVLDLDGTLITDCFPHARPSPSIRMLEIPSCDGIPDRFVPRPHVEPFLIGCRDLFKGIILATFSPQGRAQTVLETSGIQRYFDLVVGREMLVTAGGRVLEGYPPEYAFTMEGDFGLVDDFSWISPVVLLKMSFLGVDILPAVEMLAKGGTPPLFPEIEDRYIQAPEFLGDPDDIFLLDLLDAFEKNFRSDAVISA